MARPRTIDREHLLDLAEQAVASSGASTLSFGAVAAAAGLSKASVQSAFGTREALIEAMLERWISQERIRYEAVAGDNPSMHVRISAHIQISSEESDAGLRRVGTLLAALAGTEKQVGRAVEWYASRVGDFSATSEEERRLRIAFLATEGAFFIRYLVGFPMSDELWSEILKDLSLVVDAQPLNP